MLDSSFQGDSAGTVDIGHAVTVVLHLIDKYLDKGYVRH